MTFTSLGRSIARLMIILALFQIAMVLLTVSGNMNIEGWHHLMGYRSTGKVMEQSIWVIFLALCLGVATDISRNLSHSDKSGE